MVATTSVEHLRSRSERRMVDYDIDGAANLVDLGQPQGAGNKCLPIANFRRFLAGIFRSVGTHTITGVSIVAATDAAGTGATAVVTHALASAPDAVGDQVYLECDVEQIREVLAAATHVGILLELNTATDECVVFFERSDPFYPKTGLTADFIS